MKSLAAGTTLALVTAALIVPAAVAAPSAPVSPAAGLYQYTCDFKKAADEDQFSFVAVDVFAPDGTRTGPSDMFPPSWDPAWGTPGIVRTLPYASGGPDDAPTRAQCEALLKQQLAEDAYREEALRPRHLFCAFENVAGTWTFDHLELISTAPMSPPLAPPPELLAAAKPGGAVQLEAHGPLYVFAATTASEEPPDEARCVALLKAYEATNTKPRGVPAKTGVDG